MKLRLTEFERHLIRIGFFTISLIIGYPLLTPTFTIPHIIGLLLFTNGLIVLIPFFLDELGKSYPIKYRIKKSKYSYLPQVFKFSWYIIPTWHAIRTESHSFKDDDENIFGAKLTYYYSTDKRYDNEDDARNAIEKHKKYATKDLREDLFKRPNKENNKIIKI